MSALDDYGAGGLLGAQEHTPRGGAVHLVLLAGVVIAALVILGVSRWRGRCESEAAEGRSTSRDHGAESKRPTEKQ